MGLSIRLEKVAGMIKKEETIADIGTDHALIPIYLLQNKKCERAIATDINKGPLKKAEGNIIKYGLSNKIELRLGGGLSPIKPYEADCAIIAGMGAYLIKDIIEDGIEVFKSLKYIVLQPVQYSEVLREYIYNCGYNILDEDLCEEDGKYYEILKLSYGEKRLKKDPIYFEVSEKLIENKHPLINEYIEFKLNKFEKIYASITENSHTAEERKSEVKQKIDSLKELMIKCP